MSVNFVAASSQYGEASTALGTAVPLTIATWFRLSTTGVLHTLAGLFNSSAIASRDCFYLGVDAANRVIAAAANNLGLDSAIVASPTLSTGTWYFAAAVFTSFDDRNAYLYTAGTLSSGSNAASRTPAGIDRTVVGRRTSTVPDRYLNGDIQHTTFWDAALNTSELTALGKGFSPLFIRPQNILGYYPFHGRQAAGGAEYNMFRGGSDLVLNNTPTLSAATPAIIVPKQLQNKKFLAPTAVASGGMAWPPNLSHFLTDDFLYDGIL